MSSCRYQAIHHPFTAPNPQDWTAGNYQGARAIAYDLVYNGVEIGGGSLRIYRRDIQQKVFELIGRDLPGATHRHCIVTAYNYHTAASERTPARAVHAYACGALRMALG